MCEANKAKFDDLFEVLLKLLAMSITTKHKSCEALAKRLTKMSLGSFHNGNFVFMASSCEIMSHFIGHKFMRNIVFGQIKSSYGNSLLLENIPGCFFSIYFLIFILFEYVNFRCVKNIINRKISQNIPASFFLYWLSLLV